MISEQEVDWKGNRFWKVTTEPIIEPITVDEVKEFGRIDGSDEDTLITSFITAVRKNTEDYLGRALINQTITLIMDAWNVRDLELPRPPLVSITSVSTLDEDDVATTESSDNYYVITTSEPGRIVFKSGVDLPTNDDRDYGGFKIIYIAGYGTSAIDVPDAIKEAMKLWVMMVYEQRNLTKEPPPEAKIMLDLYRVIKK